MYARSLRCVICQTQYPLEPIYECKNCGGILAVTYDYPSSIASELRNNGKVELKLNLLPIYPEYAISIGEGNTPLIKAGKLAQRINAANLFLKCEFCNPTGAFKDRPVSVGVSKANEFGYKKVVVASSGNGAAAVAALAAKAGFDALIFVPESTPPEKVRQTAFYGAKVIKIEGPYSNSFTLAKDVSQTSREVYNITTTFINPYTVDGDKIIAYELFEQLNGKVPDCIFVPIGAGPLLVGIFKGYEEMKNLDIIDKVPKMVGVQAEGCSPIARAFIEGRNEVTADEHPQTIAGAICDGLSGYAQDGTFTLNIIKRSGGYALYCDDEKILEAQNWLAADEGAFVEPASASVIAAINYSLSAKLIGPEDTVVAILTGHGLKDMGNVTLRSEIETVPFDIEKIKKIIQ